MKRNRHTDVESTSPYRITWIPLKTIRIYENFVFFSCFIFEFFRSSIQLFVRSFAHPIDFVLFCADRQPIDSWEHLFNYDRLQIVRCYFRAFFCTQFLSFSFRAEWFSLRYLEWLLKVVLYQLTVSSFGSTVACVLSVLGRKSYSKVIWQIRSDY